MNELREGGTGPYIVVEDLTKVFYTGPTRVEVLSGLDLTLGRGETLAVVGASGAGKSTLLHILGTLEKPTSGRVCLNGTEISRLDDKKLAHFRNRRIGFVFQFHHLLPEFNALENAAMPALIHRLPKEAAYVRAETMLARVGLGHRLKHRVGELSGGEQQRVAVARSLVMEPELLLADEPTGNLDSRTGRQVNDLLLEIHAEKDLTTIVATHNLELSRLMSRQIRLVDGRAVEER